MKTGKFNIPESVEKILDNLETSGFEAFLVGGCVRDLVLERTPKDWDITTNATPEEIQEVFPDSFYENKFGTVGVKTEDEDPTLKVVEITPYRLESEYSDHRHPDNVTFSKNIKDDLSRRDFTINALALSKGQMVDLYKGQDDLTAKIIKTVGNPVERFREDALRIMRAVRFSAELGFTIESETSKAIFELGDLLSKVSRERIREEFVKIILSDNPMIGIVMLQKLGLLKHVSEALEGMVGVSQETQAHKYDVFEHSLRALQHSADNRLRTELRLAVLFHDVAKPHTKRMVGNKATFYGHEVVGARVTRETLESLKFSRETIENVSRLVRWHMFFSDPDKITLSAVRRMIARVGKEGIWDLVEIRKCDRIGTGRPVEEPYRFRKYQSMIDEALRAPLSVGMLKVDGVKLIEVGVEKGPRIGAILHALLEEVLDDPDKNTEEYLVSRATDLNKMSETELVAIGKQGKGRLEEEDDKVIQDLRKKHRVN